MVDVAGGSMDGSGSGSGASSCRPAVVSTATIATVVVVLARTGTAVVEVVREAGVGGAVTAAGSAAPVQAAATDASSVVADIQRRMQIMQIAYRHPAALRPVASPVLDLRSVLTGSRPSVVLPSGCPRFLGVDLDRSGT